MLADLSPCNFATTHFPAKRSSFISLLLRDHPFDSLHSEVLSPLNFATHEMEDPFATPQNGFSKHFWGVGVRIWRLGLETMDYRIMGHV